MKRFIHIILALLLLTEGGAAFAQAQITVKGRVTDSQGDPVVGAGVVDKASGNGAVTNSDTGCELTETELLINRLETYLGGITRLRAAEGSPEPTP